MSQDAITPPARAPRRMLQPTKDTIRADLASTVRQLEEHRAELERIQATWVWRFHVRMQAARAALAKLWAGWA